MTDDRELKALAVIVATGASPRILGVKGEKEYSAKGVSYCATCDGFFFKGHEIFVVGGGDSAMEEALFLTKFGERVTIVHRRDHFRASKIMAERVQGNKKVRVLWDSVVDEVLGDGKKVNAIRIENLKTGERTVHDCGGMFVAIGHTPNTALFEKVLTEDGEGYLQIRGSSSRTNIAECSPRATHDHVPAGGDRSGRRLPRGHRPRAVARGRGPEGFSAGALGFPQPTSTPLIRSSTVQRARDGDPRKDRGRTHAVFPVPLHLICSRA
jgi:pyruvate/2-oxoglutarate dehydrogenase complex dihydrolipoamide dehydrogenase (E3) component